MWDALAATRSHGGEHVAAEYGHDRREGMLTFRYERLHPLAVIMELDLRDFWWLCCRSGAGSVSDG